MICTNEGIHEFIVYENFANFWRRNVLIWQSQFPGGLIRSAGVPAWGERRLGVSRRRQGSGILKEEDRGKDKLGFVFFFASTFLGLRHIKPFFSLSRELMSTQQSTQFKLCTRDYVTTMYPAWGQFLLPENLLTNPNILECVSWEWVW